MTGIRNENDQLKQLVAELALKNRVLKKSLPGMEYGSKEILDEAVEKTGVDRVHVRHRPRLLSDNGPCYISKSLKTYLEEQGIDHSRGKPYHPMTQGKIERFVESYNNQRYYELLDNLMPKDVYEGRAQELLSRRKEIKERTMRLRKKHNLVACPNKNHTLTLY